MSPNIVLSLLFAYNELEFLAYFHSERLIYLGNKLSHTALEIILFVAGYGVGEIIEYSL
jgi:hypothetical protein